MPTRYPVIPRLDTWTFISLLSSRLAWDTPEEKVRCGGKKECVDLSATHVFQAVLNNDLATWPPIGALFCCFPRVAPARTHTCPQPLLGFLLVLFFRFLYRTVCTQVLMWPPLFLFVCVADPRSFGNRMPARGECDGLPIVSFTFFPEVFNWVLSKRHSTYLWYRIPN